MRSTIQTSVAVLLSLSVSASAAPHRRDEVVGGLAIPTACESSCDAFFSLYLPCDSQDCRCAPEAGELLANCADCIDNLAEATYDMRAQIDSVRRVHDQTCAYTAGPSTFSTVATADPYSTTLTNIGGTTYLDLPAASDYIPPTLYYYDSSTHITQRPAFGSYPSAAVSTDSTTITTSSAPLASTTASTSSAPSSVASVSPSATSTIVTSSSAPSSSSFPSSSSSSLPINSSATAISAVASSTPSAISGASALQLGGALTSVGLAVSLVLL